MYSINDDKEHNLGLKKHTGLSLNTKNRTCIKAFGKDLLPNKIIKGLPENNEKKPFRVITNNPDKLNLSTKSNDSTAKKPFRVITNTPDRSKLSSKPIDSAAKKPLHVRSNTCERKRTDSACRDKPQFAFGTRINTPTAPRRSTGPNALRRAPSVNNENRPVIDARRREAASKVKPAIPNNNVPIIKRTGFGSHYNAVREGTNPETTGISKHPPHAMSLNQILAQNKNEKKSTLVRKPSNLKSNENMYPKTTTGTTKTDSNVRSSISNNRQSQGSTTSRSGQSEPGKISYPKSRLSRSNSSLNKPSQGSTTSRSGQSEPGKISYPKSRLSRSNSSLNKPSEGSTTSRSVQSESGKISYPKNKLSRSNSVRSTSGLSSTELMKNKVSKVEPQKISRNPSGTSGYKISEKKVIPTNPIVQTKSKTICRPNQALVKNSKQTNQLAGKHIPDATKNLNIKLPVSDVVNVDHSTKNEYSSNGTISSSDTTGVTEVTNTNVIPAESEINNKNLKVNDNVNKVSTKDEFEFVKPVSQQVDEKPTNIDEQIKNADEKSTNVDEQIKNADEKSTNVDEIIDDGKNLDNIKETTGVIDSKLKKSNFQSLQLTSFDIGKSLGSGRSGHVYLARLIANGFICALKVIYKSSLVNKQAKEQLFREIEIQYILRHPHILRLYTYFEDELRVFIVLEYAPKGELYGHLKKHKKFSDRQSAKYIKQLASALIYCKKHNVIHRDLKPENILVDNKGDLKIADFGWSVQSSDEGRQTLCGTIDYIPPEMVMGSPYTDAVDRWSLGILLYEFLVGSAPFLTNENAETFKRIASVDFKIPDYVTSDAKEVITSLLKYEPNERMTLTELITTDWVNKEE